MLGVRGLSVAESRLKRSKVERFLFRVNKLKLDPVGSTVRYEMMKL